jgi:hypothetical protein
MKKHALRLPSGQECALLLLRLLEKRNEEGGVSRARLSEITLRRLWQRDRLGRELLDEVEEWLWRGGWSFFYARTTYAVVKTSAVLSWSRLSSKRMHQELAQVREGTFDFESCLHLMQERSDVTDRKENEAP